MRGEGVDLDLQRAHFLYGEAAKTGLVDAQYNLGVWYIQAKGNEQDLVSAHRWFSIVASGSNERLMEKAVRNISKIEELMSKSELKRVRSSD